MLMAHPVAAVSVILTLNLATDGVHGMYVENNEVTGIVHTTCKTLVDDSTAFSLPSKLII